MNYELVTGLEVHIQLNTDTKLFCSCSTKFGASPNSQVCPVCIGLPGVLPVINKKAVELAIKTALTLNCQIAEFTKFDRKNYYYPDLPKNYQISQYDTPLSRNGYLDIEINGKTKRIDIIRLHLEEDAGKLIHEEGSNTTLVDLNRTGIPLMEIVSSPDINSSEEAYAYLTTLKDIMQYIGVSDCDMEKGELRCDINLSLRPQGIRELGVKTEIKNLNSFKFTAKAIAYEFERQKKVLEAGGIINQETRLYDSEKDITELMRTKEEAQDYRYFPEPDLPPMTIAKDWIESIRRTIPELPSIRKRRFMEKYSLSNYDAGVLTADKAIADFFEECIKIYNNPKTIANWVINDLSRILNDRNKDIQDIKIKPDTLIDLIKMLEKGAISGASAKVVLEEIIDTGKSPKDIVVEKGLAQVSDESEIEKIVEKVITENPSALADYKSGKKTAITFLVGQVMRATKGKANPKVVNEILVKRLENS